MNKTISEALLNAILLDLSLQDVDFKDEPNITLGFLLARAFFKYKSISCFSWMKVILSRFYLSLANTNNLGPNKSLLFVAFS